MVWGGVVGVLEFYFDVLRELGVVVVGCLVCGVCC